MNIHCVMIRGFFLYKMCKKPSSFMSSRLPYFYLRDELWPNFDTFCLKYQCNGFSKQLYMGGPGHRLDDVYFYFSSSSTRMSPLYLLVNGQDLRLDYNSCTLLWLSAKTKNFCFLLFINFLFFCKKLGAKNKKNVDTKRVLILIIYL